MQFNQTLFAMPDKENQEKHFSLHSIYITLGSYNLL